MNPHVRLEDHIRAARMRGYTDDGGYDVVLPHDDWGVGYYHVNTGSWLIRQSAFSFDFLDEAWSAAEHFMHDRLWENRAVIHLLEAHDLSRHVQLVTQRRLNSYEVNYCPGDFVLHFADTPMDERLRRMRVCAQSG